MYMCLYIYVRLLCVHTVYGKTFKGETFVAVCKIHHSLENFRGTSGCGHHVLYTASDSRGNQLKNREKRKSFPPRKFCPMRYVSLLSFIVGSLTGRNGRGVYIYFVAKFSEELGSFGTWNDAHLSLESVSAVGKHCGGYAGKVLTIVTAFYQMPCCLFQSLMHQLLLLL